MAIQKTLVTGDEFEDFIARPENRNRRFELINGEIREVTPTEEHAYSGGKIFLSLGNYNEEHKLGRVLMEARYRMPNDEHNALIPDISFNLDTDRPLVKRGPMRRMPDLAVEVKSPDDSYKEMREKAAYYLTNGSRMVWLVFPEKRLIEVYQPDVDLQILNEDDVLEGDPLLPGFRLPVREVFSV